MRNFQGIVFTWTWTYIEIFKSALVYFNKKAKIGRPEHLLTPTPSTPDNISFLA